MWKLQMRCDIPENTSPIAPIAPIIAASASVITAFGFC
jgi:hypothetical protein